MKAVILDPGLTSRAGHHFNIDRALCSAFRRRGIAPFLIGHRDCDEETAGDLPMTRAFSIAPYTRLRYQPEYQCLWEWLHLNQRIEQDLSGLAFPAFAPGDLVLVPTAVSNQCFGLAQWYQKLPPPRPDVCLQFMFPPEFRLPPQDHAIATALYRRALEPWLSVRDAAVAIVCDNRRLAARLSVRRRGKVGHLRG